MDADLPRDTALDRPVDGAVLARLARIDALGRRHAPPGALLDELRGLLRDAETGTASTGTGEEVVERLCTAPHGT